MCLKNTGVEGCMLEFLLSSYGDNYNCKVKVGEMNSEEFLTSVELKLKDVCFLRCCSLFTLVVYIMMVELKRQGRDVKCNGVLV